MNSEKLLFNGKKIEPSDLNFIKLRRGFLYGDGLFETLISRNKKIFRFHQHWERLRKGAQICNLKLPDIEKIKKLIGEELENRKLGKNYIRINIWRKRPSYFHPEKEQETEYLIIIKKFKPYPEKFYENGVRCIVSNKIRRNEKTVLSKIKSFNYLENIILKIESEENGVDDAIVLNSSGYITCGSVSNIFLVKKGNIYTPSLKCGCLEGITRKVIFEICEREKIKIKEGIFKVNFLNDCEEIFLTNTLMGVMPVREIKGYFKTKKFPFTENLIEKYKKIFEKETE